MPTNDQQLLGFLQFAPTPIERGQVANRVRRLRARIAGPRFQARQSLLMQLFALAIPCLRAQHHGKIFHGQRPVDAVLLTGRVECRKRLAV